MNYCKPRMAKRPVIKIKNMVAFPISGRDLSKVVTCLRMLGLALILLRGLITLNILKALKLISYASNSINLYFISNDG
jgi:hypothetical protein